MFEVREKSSPAHFGPFLVQICPFLAPNQHFGLYLPNGSLNFADFCYINLSYSLLLENWCLQSGKNPAPPILGPFWSKFAPFWPKINIWAYIFQTAHWILLIFGIETFLMAFFWKIEVYSPGKIEPRPFWLLSVQIWTFLGPTYLWSLLVTWDLIWI